MARVVGFGIQAACGATPLLNVLQYVVPLLVIWLALRGVFATIKVPTAKFRPYLTDRPRFAEAAQ